MPDPRELPRVSRPVVPLMGARGPFVAKLVAHRVPRLAAIVRALDQLPEPARGLRGEQPIGIRWRSLEVVHLPSPEEGAGDVPGFPRSIRCQDERALTRPDQNPYAAHVSRASLLCGHKGMTLVGSRTDRCIWQHSG